MNALLRAGVIDRITEPYFPTRLLTDVAFMILGNRGGDLAHLKYNGLARRPLESIVGGDGLVVGSGLPVPPTR